jgi:hypothetical protein
MEKSYNRTSSVVINPIRPSGTFPVWEGESAFYRKPSLFIQLFFGEFGSFSPCAACNIA